MNVVVTGASRGIGLELTKIFLQAGHRVLAVARKAKSVTALNQLSRDFSTNLILADVDLTQEDSLDKVKKFANEMGAVDILVNNAGVMRLEDSVKEFQDSFLINSIIPYQMTKALLPLLKESKDPKVIHITSLMGSISDNTSGGYYAYRASKTALNMINKSLAHDHNWLTTVVVHPGWVKTDMGGPNAPTSVSESAQGIVGLTLGLKRSSSGRFFNFQGKELPW